MKSLTVALAITSTLLVSPGWADETLFLLERKIPLGEVRGRIDHLAVDLGRNRLFVAHGHGGLTILDAASRRKVAEIDLGTHPEGFQLDQANKRIFVNDPTNQAIVVVDRAAGKEVARWPTGDGGNFPMALYPKAEHVVVAFRNPARLAAYSIADGAAVANVELCADADDVFVDAKRERVYVSCGDGHLDVFDARGNAYRRIGHLVTQLGARTSLFVPELNLLFIAARATSSEPAAIWVFSQQRCKQRVAPVGGSRHSSAKAFS